jgi:predicted phosphohydrolase
MGTLPEIVAFFEWFGTLPHRHKVVIAGNHDFGFERMAEQAEALVPANVIYLRDAGCEVEGLRLWGSPWQPWFMDWAFNLERGPEIAEKWAMIPDDVQVLITHGPPLGVLDLTQNRPPEHAGCADLGIRITQLPDLRLHVFGHIHEGYGRVEQGGVTFVNASICDAGYVPRNRAVVVEI